LPLFLLGGIPAGQALQESKARLAGRRGSVMRFLLLWGLAFAALFAVSGALLQFSTGLVIDLAAGTLQAVAWIAGATIALWSITNLFIGLFASVSFALAVRAAWRRWAPAPDEANKARLAALDAGDAVGRPMAIILGLVAVVLVLEAFVLSRQLDGFRNDDRPDIMAHRGASWDAPENTMAAIEEAIRQGADWVEIDVQETHDGRVLVAHDRDLMKVAGSPLRIFDAPFEELRAVDIGSFKDSRFSDQRLPLFEEVLELARGRVKLNIELKYYGQEERLEERVAELIDRYGMADEVVLMSLSLPGVRAMKGLRPDWTVGLLSSVAVGDITRLDVDFFAINARFASRAFVDRAQGRGKGVFTWTVNDPAGMSAMIGKGVDGIITDRPGLAQRVWEERLELSVLERILVQVASRLGSDYDAGQ
ncbi:MAG: glycerophosphodiester phosphodiesterase family protein, partial [Pseudomonadota bacterium]